MGGSSARSTIAVGGRLRRKWRNAPTQKGAPGGPSVRGANGGGSCACRGALTCIYGMLVFGVGRRRLPFIEHLLPGGVGGALAVRLDVSLRYSCGTETPSVRFMMMTTEAPPEGGLSREKSLWPLQERGPEQRRRNKPRGGSESGRPAFFSLSKKKSIEKRLTRKEWVGPQKIGVRVVCAKEGRRLKWACICCTLFWRRRSRGPVGRSENTPRRDWTSFLIFCRKKGTRPAVTSPFFDRRQP